MVANTIGRGKKVRALVENAEARAQNVEAELAKALAEIERLRAE